MHAGGRDAKKKAGNAETVEWDIGEQRRQAYAMLGLLPAQFYDLDPHDLYELLGAAVERRKYERSLLAWHAVIVVNGTGNRKKPLTMADVLGEGHARGRDAAGEQNEHTHRQVLERLGRLGRMAN